MSGLQESALGERLQANPDPPRTPRRRCSLYLAALGVAAALGSSLTGCRSTKALSSMQARAHARELVELVEQDLKQVRQGLPLGAALLAEAWSAQQSPLRDVTRAEVLLRRSRSKIRQLRVAKSTFFALADVNGKVARSDRIPDELAGGALFAQFPSLKSALLRPQVVEARGKWAKANTARGIPDGQWVAAYRVESSGQVLGLYATGWSWAAYAHRLEFSLRSELKSEAKRQNSKLPLVYVYLAIDGEVYGGPKAPRVTAAAIARLPIAQALAEDPEWKTELEVTGRTFGLGAAGVPGLGQGTYVCVVRSET